MSWLKPVKPIVIYTDGSCLKNPGGRGGWAAIIVEKGIAKELSGHDPSTTNNRMELMAVIKALQSLPTGSSVYVFTDSQYVKRGILYWVQGWKRRNWKTQQNQEVMNRDLWELLDTENDRHMVSWHWVKGHQEDKYNQRCDELAGQAARLQLIANNP